MVVFWELLLQLGFPWQLNLLQKYLGKDCKFPKKLQLVCKFLEKLELVSKFLRSLFYGNHPPSMAHGRGREEERGKKEKDFCWEKTAHSTKSPSWEQFFKRS